MAENDWGDLPENEWGDKPEAASPAPAGPKSGRESVKGEEAPGFWRGVARGGWALPGLAGLDYETAAGAEMALRDPQGLAAKGMGLRDRFRWYQDAERERSRRGESEHPVRTGLGIGAGSAPSVALMPQTKAAEGAGLAARAGASAINAATQAATVEGGVTGGLPVDERLKRMGAAAVIAAPLGALAPRASRMPTQAALDEAAGIPKGATPESAKIAAEGVPLTPGQMKPKSTWAQLEEVSTSNPIFGPKIKEARDAAREEWARKAFGKGAAPGEAVPVGATPGENISALREGFEKAYESIRGEMDPQAVQGVPDAFRASAAKPDVLATDATRREVARFLDNQLTLLDREAPTVEKLLKIRSNIRAAKRSAGDEALPLLRDAENAVSKSITEGAPADAAERLAAIDAQYAKFKTLERASRNAADQVSGMTPTHLSSAVKANTPGPAYAAGGGGPLRDWAAAGKEVFDTKTPMTRARLLVAPPGTRYPIAALAALRASRLTPAVVEQGSELGSEPALAVLRRAIGSAGGREVASEPAATVLSPPVGLHAAAAGDDMPAGSAPAPTPVQGEQHQGNEQPPSHDPDLGTSGAVPQVGQAAPKGSTSQAEHVHVGDRIATLLANDPQALGAYAAPLAIRLRTGGPRAVAAYDFVEQQRNPAYRDHMAKAIGDERLT